MESDNKSFFDRLNSWIRTSVTLKLLSIGILILLLLIPAIMVQDLIRERQATSESAETEVSSKWGESQQVAGPFIVVPAKRLISENGKMLEQMEYFYFLPEKLNVSGEIFPEKRYRGVYEVVLYKSTLNVSGVFSKPDFTEWKSENHTILWGDA